MEIPGHITRIHLARVESGARDNFSKMSFYMKPWTKQQRRKENEDIELLKCLLAVCIGEEKKRIKRRQEGESSICSCRFSFQAVQLKKSIVIWINSLKQKPNLFLPDFGSKLREAQRRHQSLLERLQRCVEEGGREELGGGGGSLLENRDVIKEDLHGKGLGSTFLSQPCDQMRSRPSTLEARHRRCARLTSTRSWGTGRKEIRGPVTGKQSGGDEWEDWDQANGNDNVRAVLSVSCETSPLSSSRPARPHSALRPPESESEMPEGKKGGRRGPVHPGRVFRRSDRQTVKYQETWSLHSWSA